MRHISIATLLSFLATCSPAVIDATQPTPYAYLEDAINDDAAESITYLLNNSQEARERFEANRNQLYTQAQSQGNMHALGALIRFEGGQVYNSLQHDPLAAHMNPAVSFTPQDEPNTDDSTSDTQSADSDSSDSQEPSLNQQQQFSYDQVESAVIHGTQQGNIPVQVFQRAVNRHNMGEPSHVYTITRTGHNGERVRLRGLNRNVLDTTPTRQQLNFDDESTR